MQQSAESMMTKMTKFPVILLSSLLISSPALADGYRTYQGGYAEEHSCYRYEYREEYVPGTSSNPGYVRNYREKVQVPCNRGLNVQRHTPRRNVDDNSCVEGAILGGILGGGAGAAMSRGDGRWWAIPLGIVGGSMVGCQIDGG